MSYVIAQRFEGYANMQTMYHLNNNHSFISFVSRKNSKVQSQSKQKKTLMRLIDFTFTTKKVLNAPVLEYAYILYNILTRIIENAFY